VTRKVAPGGKPAAVLALARGAGTSHAADEAGVTSRTIQRWLLNPDFAAEVRSTRRDLIDRAVGELAASATLAARTLREALGDRSAAIRVRAARSLLQHVRELTEFAEAEARLADLEAIAAAGHPLRLVKGAR
jgi:hypothetical protein